MAPWNLKLITLILFGCLVMITIYKHDDMNNFDSIAISADSVRQSMGDMHSFLSNQLKPGKSQIDIGFLRSYYGKQAPQRTAALATIHAAMMDFATLYNVLVPEVYCPDLIRVGNVNDGGKWICKPQAMPQSNCSIYSLGLRDDVTFDRDLQLFNNNSCKLYGYDVTPQNPHTLKLYSEINGVAKAMKISNRTKLDVLESTLGDLMTANGDTYTEMLKMDIEGAEYYTLPDFLATHKVCQIFIEMHGLPMEMLTLIRKISAAGYNLYFFEVNGNSMKACEYSFIHDDCYERYGAFMLEKYISPPGTAKAPAPPVQPAQPAQPVAVVQTVPAQPAQPTQAAVPAQTVQAGLPQTSAAKPIVNTVGRGKRLQIRE